MTTLLALLCLPAALSQPLSLRATLEEALRANPGLRQERIELVQADLGVEASRAAFDPTAFFGVDGAAEGAAGAGRTSATTFSTGVSQPLPTGGSASLSWYGTRERGSEPDLVEHDADVQIGLSQPLLDGLGPFAARYAVRAAERGRDYQALAYRAACEDLVVAVATAYWGLIEARETLAVNRRTLAAAEQQLEETRTRREEGFAALGDVLQVERAVSVARQAEVVAAANAEGAELALLRLLGRDLTRRAPVALSDRPSVPAQLPDLGLSLEIAREYNASWLQQEILLEGAAEALRLARQRKLPSLDLTVGVGLAGTSDTARDARAEVFLGRQPSSAVGLTLSMPIPGRASALALDEAWLESQRVRLVREAAAADLTRAVEDAVRALHRDAARAGLAHQTVQIAQAALAADEDLLREGRGSTREVVRSLEAVDAAQIASLQADIDLQLSILALHRVEGLLLTRLDLEAQALPR